jgi:general secretion pathway protein K
MKNERGAALVLVLLILTILVVVVLESMRLAQVDYGSTAVMETGLRAKYKGLSGLNMAKLLLTRDAADSAGADHLGEPWASMLEQREIELPEMKEMLSGGIVDEQSKFPVNFLLDARGNLNAETSAVLTNLLTGPAFELDREAAEEIVLSLKDWLDQDDEVSGTSGAEEFHYAEAGYKPRNGPMRFLGELLLVRGITREIYAGTADRPGLKDLVTVYGDGKINLNTAPVELVAAMIRQDETGTTPRDALDFAQRVVEYRADYMHWDQLDSTQWFTNVPGALSVQFYPLLTVKSSWFSVALTAHAGGGQRSLFAVLKREPAQEQAPSTLKTLYLEMS